jgi:hypothetical protein
MKNFNIECPICPIIKQNIINYISDIKKIFTPNFVKQNYHKHLGYSAVFTFFAIWFLFQFAHLQDTGILFPLFIGGFGAYCVNWVREWYYGKKYDAPWDDTDPNMGSYGGIIGTAIFLLTIAQLIY